MQPTPPFCPICQTSVTEDLEVTPCNHAFHRQCLDGWRAYNQCPLCKQPLNPHEPVQPVQYEGTFLPVLQPGDVGYQPGDGDNQPGDVGYQPGVDLGGYLAPPNSPAEVGADTMVCPACQVVRTLFPYAPGLGAPDCVVVNCGQPCQVGIDYVFAECGHAIHAVCP